MTDVSLLDNIYALKVLKMLVTKFEDTPAFKAGLIDKDGNRLKKQDQLTHDEKKMYDYLDRVVFKLKKLINATPGGEHDIKNLAAAYWLVKEEAGEREVDSPEGYYSLVEEFLREEGEGAAVPANSTAGVEPKGSPVIRPKEKSKVVKRKLTTFKDYIKKE